MPSKSNFLNSSNSKKKKEVNLKQIFMKPDEKPHFIIFLVSFSYKLKKEKLDKL